MKVCSICKLPKDKFYKNSHRPDGLQTYCVDCAKERSKARYKGFSEEEKRQIKDAAKEKTRRNKQFLWDYLKQNPCVDCGETDPVVLDFDHTTGNKLGSLANLANQGSSIESLQEEISKCQVRCAHCHRRKTAKELGWYKDIVA
jgi:hypothetical protein